ncbi:hypothetical protein PQR71_08860 [Paraburkholderia fungorum]|uniref:RraA family protein n=1 Tax=Paraburkholderia fungorum TaxID=134537 RepID=UPI0038BCED85
MSLPGFRVNPAPQLARASVVKALTMLQPGHALVIDGGGESNNVLVGELIKLHAQKLGCVGFVIDGAIRDVASFEDFPCYARSVIHRGPYKDGPGELNVPVSVGGQVVNPGDIVVGDEDGVVNFAQADAEELIALAESTTRRNGRFRQKSRRDIASRNGLSRFWPPKVWPTDRRACRAQPHV